MKVIYRVVGCVCVGGNLKGDSNNNLKLCYLNLPSRREIHSCRCKTTVKATAKTPKVHLNKDSPLNFCVLKCAIGY